MPRTAKREASFGFSSVFIWMTAALPANSSAACRTAGANETQCGHHGAQNSASIGPSKRATKSSKLRSPTCCGRR